MKLRYLEFDSTKGYPTGPNLLYECEGCKKLVPSLPQNNTWCDCRNLCIDVDAGRLAVKDASLLKLAQADEEAK